MLRIGINSWGQAATEARDQSFNPTIFTFVQLQAPQTMVSLAFALVALLTQDVLAQTGSARGADFLRFGCSQLVIERTDPLVNPGVIPSAHMHQVVGGSSFNASVRLQLAAWGRRPANQYYRWTPLIWTRLRIRNAHLARCLRISATIGPPLSTSNHPRTARSDGFLKWQTAA